MPPTQGRTQRSTQRRVIATLTFVSASFISALITNPSLAQTTTTTPTSTTTSAVPTTSPSTTTPPQPLKRLTLQKVASGLVMPVEVVAPLSDGLLFVIERPGIVRIVEAGRVLKQPFANLKSVVRSNSIEQGLLGMAFHPRYPEDRRVFFFHSIKGNDNVLVSYRVDPDGRKIDPNSRVQLLKVDKEPDAVRHNAGALRFAPDGLLYISVGDAARASVNGQNPKTLPGSILRIDVDTKQPYGIPASNTFADGINGAPEVFWYGLRNPWRFSIDAKSGLAYVADVGQEKYEEVNVVKFDAAGVNFGWPLFEGTKRYSKGEPKTAVTPPVLEVRHGDPEGGCSITGGEVYRGKAIPELDGHYFYADWCLGWIRSFLYDGSKVTNKKDWSEQLVAEMVSAFGHDSNGELLVVDYEGGSVSRVVAVR